MLKKTVCFVFSFIGIISLFLPYNQDIVISCGENYSSKDYYYNSFIKFVPEFFNSSLSFNSLIEALLLLIIYFSLVFSPILFLFDKIKTSIVFIVLTLILMSMSFFSSNDDLAFGYYVMVFHQILLLFYILKSKYKSNLS